MLYDPFASMIVGSHQLLDMKRRELLKGLVACGWRSTRPCARMVETCDRSGAGAAESAIIRTTDVKSGQQKWTDPTADTDLRSRLGHPVGWLLLS